MSQSPENAAAESALAEYRAVGPAPFLGELPQEAGEWRNALCAPGVELSPAQELGAAWLDIELGHQMSRNAGTRKTGGPKRYSPGVTATHALMKSASDRLKRAIDEDAPDYTRAQLHLAYGAIPLLRVLDITGSQTVTVAKRRAEYRLAQAVAVDYMYSTTFTRELTSNEQAFIRSLNLLVTGNSLTSDMVFLPAPPRSYEDADAKHSWHLILWNSRRGLFRPVALAYETALRDVSSLLNGEREEGRILYEGIALLKELRTAMTDERHKVPSETSLGRVAINVAAYFSDLTGRRVPSTLKLPDLSRFILGSAEPLAAPELPVDLDPVAYPEINLGGLTADNAFEWYGWLVNGRPLTRQEGLNLNRVLLELTEPASYERLTIPERVLLNKMRLECAVAVADDFRPVAIDQLDRIASTTRPLQEAAMQTRDIVSLYEAAVDDLRLRIIGAGIRGEPAALSKVDVMDELAAMFQEIDSERNSLKDKNSLRRLDTLTQDILYAVLAMRYTGGPDLIALPAVAREKGNAEYPGWDINVWRVGGSESGGALGSRRKVRISGAVDRPMRQGDIAVIPLAAIRKTASIKDIARNFISLAREDERSNRARNLFERWSAALRPLFEGALELVG